MLQPHGYSLRLQRGEAHVVPVLFVEEFGGVGFACPCKYVQHAPSAMLCTGLCHHISVTVFQCDLSVQVASFVVSRLKCQSLARAAYPCSALGIDSHVGPVLPFLVPHVALQRT